MLIPMRQFNRGTSLMMALLVLSLSSVVVFSIASLSTVQLRTSASSEEDDHARNLAESALYLGIDKVCLQGGYGTHGEDLDVPVVDFPPDSLGKLTFNAAHARNLGIGTSFNNFGSKTNGTSPDGRTVPGQTCLLVALGRSGSARVQVECMYYRPSFPTGLVTGGALTAGGLTMAALMPGVDFLGNLASHAPADLRPVDLHSNGSVHLTGNSLVSGDVSSTAAVTLSSTTRVRGEVRENTAPQTIPRLDIAQIRQSMLSNGIAPLMVPSSMGSVNVQWYSECADQLVVNGDLNLDGGVLYVPGPVDVKGRVLGRGALLARGSITVEQGGSLNDRDVTVLASDSDVTLLGQGANRFFHGLVYSGGKLLAKDMTVVGSVVCRGQAEVENSLLVQTEVATSMAVGRPMRSANHDDVFFWYVNRGEPDPSTREPRYDYFLSIYVDAFTSQFNGAPNFQQKGTNRTRAQITSEFLAFADSDYQAVDDLDPAPVIRGSVMLAGPLSNYLNDLDGAGPATVNFDLNRLLTPIQTSRILLWRRRP